MIGVGIITAPRPKPTLNASVRSLREDAGCNEKVSVFSDGPFSGLPCGDVMMVRNTPPLGNFRNWVRALQFVYKKSDADWLMICEDDIVWAKGSWKVLLEETKPGGLLYTLPQLGAVSLYLPIRMSKLLENGRTLAPRNGYHYLRMQVGLKMWGAQCLMLPRAEARRFLEGRGLDHYIERPRWKKNVDGIVADVMQTMGLRIYWRIPCLVDHTPLGEGNSTLGYADDRPNLRTKYFTGTP